MTGLPTCPPQNHGVARRAPGVVGLLLLGSLLAGCAGPIEGLYPPAPGDPVKPVYVIDHGWHTGIAVRRRDIPEGVWPEVGDLVGSELVEVGWGARDFYLAPEGTAWLAFKAAFWPAPGVLHIVGFDGPVDRVFPGREIVEVLVTDRGFRRLAVFLQDAHARDGATRTTPLRHGHVPNSRFYVAREQYFLLKTCNTWTARALRSAGVPITALYAVTAGNVMAQARGFGTVVAR